MNEDVLNNYDDSQNQVVDMLPVANHDANTECSVTTKDYMQQAADNISLNEQNTDLNSEANTIQLQLLKENVSYIENTSHKVTDDSEEKQDPADALIDEESLVSTGDTLQPEKNVTEDRVEHTSNEEAAGDTEETQIVMCASEDVNAVDDTFEAALEDDPLQIENESNPDNIENVNDGVGDPSPEIITADGEDNISLKSPKNGEISLENVTPVPISLSATNKCNEFNSTDPATTSEVIGEVVDCGDINNSTWEEDTVQPEEEDPLLTGIEGDPLSNKTVPSAADCVVANNDNAVKSDDAINKTECSGLAEVRIDGELITPVEGVVPSSSTELSKTDDVVNEKGDENESTTASKTKVTKRSPVKYSYYKSKKKKGKKKKKKAARGVKTYVGPGYTCDYCKKTFPKRSRLIVHIKIHTGEKDYSCTVCLKSFYNRGSLIQHMKIHTGQKDFECDFCKKRFTQKVHLVHHTKTHTGQRDYKCTVCNKSFIEKRRLLNHFKIHTGQKDHKCQVCGSEFISKADVRKHFNRVHKDGNTKVEDDSDLEDGKEQKPRKCPMCESIFDTKVQLFKHIKEHYENAEGEMKCSMCNKLFITKRNLFTHIRLHIENKSYACTVCNKTFRRRTHLKLHTRIHYDQKDYKCEFCNKKFRQNSHLMLHIKIHTGQKDFVCTVCSKAFVQKGHLLSHMKVHSTVREFKCTKCNKEFFQKATLVKHLKTHDENRHLIVQRKLSNKLSNDIVMKYKNMYSENNKNDLVNNVVVKEEPTENGVVTVSAPGDKKIVSCTKSDKEYICNACGRRFVYFNNFVSHSKIHTTDQRDFVCEVCQKGFICRSHLIAHSKQHAEKKFKCNICSKMFLLKSNLTQHLRTHNNDFVCVVCKQIFKENGLLVKHMEKHMRDVNVFYLESL